MSSIPMESILLGSVIGWLAADCMGLTQALYRTGDTDKQSAFDKHSLQKPSSFWMEYCRTWITIIEQRLQANFPKVLLLIDNSLKLSPANPLKAGQAVAIWIIQSLTICVCLWILWMMAFPESSSASTLGVVAGLMWFIYQYQSLKLKAQTIKKRIKIRLPSLAELLAINLESGGADILTGMRLFVQENENHPLGEHVRFMLKEIDLGAATVAIALMNFADKIDDAEILEFVLPIRAAEEQGTPLKDVLRIIAEQSRLRRFQQLEREAEAAKVNVTYPGILMMIACLALATAPLLIAAQVEFGF